MDKHLQQRNVLRFLEQTDYYHIKIYQQHIIKLEKNLEKKLEQEDIYLDLVHL